MKYLIITLLLLLTTLHADAPVSAAAKSSLTEKQWSYFSATSRNSINSVLDKAASEGMDTEILERKIHEGIAKGIGQQRILKTLNHRYTRLQKIQGKIKHSRKGNMHAMLYRAELRHTARLKGRGKAHQKRISPEHRGIFDNRKGPGKHFSKKSEQLEKKQLQAIKKAAKKAKKQQKKLEKLQKKLEEKKTKLEKLKEKSNAQ